MIAALRLRVVLALVPPLTLIFVVLGSIILGIATVNQAGSIGAIGATVMAGYRLSAGKRNAYYPAILALVSLAGVMWVLSRYDLNIKNVQDGDMLGLVAGGRLRQRPDDLRCCGAPGGPMSSTTPCAA